MTLDDLRAAHAAGEIDTVILAGVDMQGRLMGKRFHAAHFLDSAHAETHCCNYLLTVDIEMVPVPGYASASWEQGYGDYTLKPDLSTLRRVPWLPATALVIADYMDHHGHALIPQAPRSILRAQVERARAMGFEAMMATELEFYYFENSYAQIRDQGLHALRPVSAWNADYSIQGTGREEPLMRALRNGLYAAGVPVECTKGEADVGQAEINTRYGPAMVTADNHILVKHAAKDIAHDLGQSVTFMAKVATGKAGSSSHVHQSLRGLDGAAVFHDPGAERGMSALMQAYLAGQLAHAREITLFLAPYVNSYKRFCVGLFAPTKAVWSADNRTAGFRVCAEGTKGVRVECRIGGADLNPYLACAALLAAGLDGIDKGMALEPAHTGDAYAAQGIREIPKTLREAADLADRSAWLRSALGDDVVDHYVHAARWELAEADRHVTDFDLNRGFDRA